MKGKKGLLLSILCSCIFCMVFCLTIFVISENMKSEDAITPDAADIAGSGTETDPYLIYTVSGYRTLLRDYAQSSGYNKVYVRLEQDLIITFSDHTQLPDWSDSLNACPEGVFKGGLEFDGNYKEIQFTGSVDLSKCILDTIGPIPRVDGHVIVKNLKTRGNVTITGNNGFNVHVGGLIGGVFGNNSQGHFNPNAIIENCHVGVNITSQSSSVTCAGGLIGYMCNSSGAFYGSITVNNTIQSGSISGTYADTGNVTADLDVGASQYFVEISNTNSYFCGSIVGQTTDANPGFGFSSAYPTASRYVNGDWEGKYSSYNYSISPNLSWLQNRNNAGKNPYTVSYKVVTTGGKTITDGQDGYLLGVTKDEDWTYSNMSIKLYNFGVVDKSIDLASYVKNYVFKEATSTSNSQTKTIEIVITVTSQPVNIYFNLANNTTASYSVDGGKFTTITSYYPQTIADVEKVELNYINYNKRDCYSACEFSFVNYDGLKVVVRYEINKPAYYISEFEYKIKDSTSWTKAYNRLSEISVGDIRDFRVGTELKSYSVEFK